MKEQLGVLLATVEKELLNVGFDQSPTSLYKPAEYLLNIGGKRLRPIVTLLGCGVFTNPLKAMPQALAVEVFHNFTLMHDDIMDDAPLRRGQETVHEKWNLNTAILSGDAMLVKSYQLLAQCEATILPELLSVFSETALQVCEGQQHDMDFETRSEVTEAEYIGMIQQKTSVLLGCAIKMGALVGGASADDAAKLYQFGLLLGTSFQIKDDLLDCFGDPEKVGKQVGGDIVSNKKTLLLIQALKTAKGDDAATLNAWINKKQFDPKEKVDAVKATYRNLEIEDFANTKMNFYFKRALKNLDDVSATPEQKKTLYAFADWLMKRDS